MSENTIGKVLIGRVHVGKNSGDFIWEEPGKVFKKYEDRASKIYEHLAENGTHTYLSVFTDAMKLIHEIENELRCVKKSGDKDAHYWIKDAAALDQDWRRIEIVTCEHGHCEPWEVFANNLLNKMKEAKFRPVFAGLDDLQRLAQLFGYICMISYLNEEEEE